MGSEPHIYDRLPDNSSIRLLTLHPGKGNDKVEVSLEIANLSADLKYEALSYVWGPPNPTDSILCQDQRFGVRINLALALKRLRLPDKPRCLWIDAICINQDNEDERTQQTAKMRDIYSRAQKVFMWMGYEDEAQAYSAVQLMELIKTALMSKPELANITGPARIMNRNILINHEVFREHSQAALKFLRNEWFQRVWTFQEAYLAQEAVIVCGAVEYPFFLFVALWHEMTRMSLVPSLDGMECSQTLIATCASAMEDRLSDTPPASHKRLRLSTLLRYTHCHQATDPRDRVYALLAMTQPVNDTRFIPDYRLSTVDAYTQAARALIEDDGHLQILSDAQSRKHDPSLPSWVPNWQGISRLKPLADRDRGFAPKYRMHGSFAVQLETFLPPSTDANKLKLRGVRLGRIRSAISLGDIVRNLAADNVSFSGWRRPLSAVKELFTLMNLSFLHLPDTYAPTAEAILSAFVKTIAADDLPCSRRGPPSDMKAFFPLYANFESLTWRQAVHPLPFEASMMGDSPYVDMVGGPTREVDDFLFGKSELTRWPSTDAGGMLTKLKIETVYWNIATDIATAIRTRSRGRAVFVTDTGYLGLGPEDAKFGDKVYDLLGGDVPFILRSTEMEHEFRLVGDCYVHGVMDGQLWRATADGLGLESVHGKLEWKEVTLV